MIKLEPIWKSYIVQTNVPIFTKEQCQHIIRCGQSLPQQDGLVGNKPKEKIKDEKIRISKISWIPFDYVECRPMYSKLEQWVKNININHFGFEGIEITEQAQYTEYNKGEFYDWHMDSDVEFSKQPPVRKISMTLLLSDEKDFEGGELELIKEQNEAKKLKQGHAIFFASFIRHRVKPVTKGTRSSLVMWFGGPSFK